MEEIALWLAGAGPKHKRWRQGRALVDLLVFMVTARRDERRRQRGRRPRVEIETEHQGGLAAPHRAARIQRSHRAHAGARHRRLDGHFQRGGGVLLKPLPFAEADRIVEIFQAIPARQINQSSLSEANTWDIKDLNQAFSEMGFHSASSR